MIGQTISHYRIVEKLGEGGMGVVYKAEDTKLKRTVALKFLHHEALEGPGHKKRFLQEAQAAAALTHPNVCTIYEIDEVEGRSFIAMERVEGQSIKQKIEARPLKLSEALDIAVQVAEGLHAAHEQGVVHRDIKPSNLIVTPRGQVKVMDFGLAQLVERTRITETGTKLGTPAYMSPEQVQGEAVDRRTDVWSLGVLFYEMVSGQLPFKGDREAAVAYTILHEEPEALTALRSGLPLELDRFIEKALAKSPQERYQRTEEMIVDLRVLARKFQSGKTAVSASTPAIAKPSADAAVGPNWKLHAALAAVFVSAIAGWTTALLRSVAEPGQEIPYRQFTIEPRGLHGSGLLVGLNRPVISPDGRFIAYVGLGSSLWLYDLTNSDDRPIEGVESRGLLSWSPDSRWICYVSRDRLFKISVDGGTPQRLAEIAWPGFFGSSWSQDGRAIVFSAGSPARLYEVSSNGGSPKLLFESEPAVDDDGSYLNPHFALNDSRRRLLLYRVLGTENSGPIIARDLDSGEFHEIESGTWRWPFYSPTGHLLVKKPPGEFFALPFSVDTIRAQDNLLAVSSLSSLAGGSGFASVSQDGTLVHEVRHPGLQRLAWVDRQGNRIRSIGDSHFSITRPRLSPDGRHIVASVRRDEGEVNLWIYDLERDSSVPLTFDGGSDPAWTAEAERILFHTPNGILVQAADGSGQAQQLLASPPGGFYPYDVSRAGNVIYSSWTPAAGSDILYTQIGQDNKVGEQIPFADTNFDELAPALSPDGRYLAYESDESGRYEVYLQPFPEGGRKEKVSTNGGGKPRWRGDGRELFYVEENGTLVAVSVTLSPEVSFGERQELFREPNLLGRSQTYDLTPDGRQFVIRETVDDTDYVDGFRVIQNWFAPFRD